MVGAVVFALGVLTIGVSDPPGDVVEGLAFGLVALGMGLASGLFRIAPGLALGLVWLTSMLQVMSRLDISPAQLAVVIVAYGTGRYEKCANCMVHSGYEATAVADTLARPLAAARVALAGVRTRGPMAPEISLSGQRPAEYVHARHAAIRVDEIRRHRADARAGSGAGSGTGPA